MAELLNHQHCRVCDRAIQFGEKTCEEHAQEFEAIQKKKKRFALILYASAAVFMILLARQLLLNLF